MRRRRPRRVGRVRACAAHAAGGRDRPRRRRSGTSRPVAAPSSRASSPCSAGKCTFFTALGDDALGACAEAGSPSSARRACACDAASTRRAWTHVDGDGERTITVLGEKLLPRGPAAARGYDPCSSSRATSTRFARRARRAFSPRRCASSRRCARPRSRSTCSSAASTIPASSTTRRSTRRPSSSRTARAEGPRTASAYRRRHAPGAVVDTYGAGDSFAAALRVRRWRAATTVDDALALGARAGARRDRGRGPYTAQLTFVLSERARLLDLAHAGQGARHSQHVDEIELLESGPDAATGASTSSTRAGGSSTTRTARRSSWCTPPTTRTPTR